jgi:hypothetical protein
MHDGHRHSRQVERGGELEVGLRLIQLEGLQLLVFLGIDEQKLLVKHKRHMPSVYLFIVHKPMPLIAPDLCNNTLRQLLRA